VLVSKALALNTIEFQMIFNSHVFLSSKNLLFRAMGQLDVGAASL